jgi:hypothetical protein
VTGLPPPVPTADEANRRAEEILSRPEFDEPPQSMVEQALEWVQNLVGRVLTDLLQSGAGSVLSWAVILLGLVLVALLASRVIRTAQSDPGAARVEMVERRRSPADWRAEAERLEAQGRWRHGLRARYRALIADLVDREVLREIPGRTAGEYRSELGTRAPAVAGEFSGASELFERAWYGNIDTGPTEAERFRELADQVVSGARG